MSSSPSLETHRTAAAVVDTERVAGVICAGLLTRTYTIPGRTDLSTRRCGAPALDAPGSRQGPKPGAQVLGKDFARYVLGQLSLLSLAHTRPSAALPVQAVQQVLRHLLIAGMVEILLFVESQARPALGPIYRVRKPWPLVGASFGPVRPALAIVLDQVLSELVEHMLKVSHCDMKTY